MPTSQDYFVELGMAIRRLMAGRYVRSKVFAVVDPVRAGVILKNARIMGEDQGAIMVELLRTNGYASPVSSILSQTISARELRELVAKLDEYRERGVACVALAGDLDRFDDRELGDVLDALFAASRARAPIMLIATASPRIHGRCGNLRPSSEMLLEFHS